MTVSRYFSVGIFQSVNFYTDYGYTEKTKLENWDGIKDQDVRSSCEFVYRCGYVLIDKITVYSCAFRQIVVNIFNH